MLRLEVDRRWFSRNLDRIKGLFAPHRCCSSLNEARLTAQQHEHRLRLPTESRRSYPRFYRPGRGLASIGVGRGIAPDRRVVANTAGIVDNQHVQECRIRVTIAQCVPPR
jgi:hypothetical protein